MQKTNKLDLDFALLLALGISVALNAVTVLVFSDVSCQLKNPSSDAPPISLGDALMEPAMPVLIFPTPKAVPIPLVTTGAKN